MTNLAGIGTVAAKRRPIEIVVQGKPHHWRRAVLVLP